MKIFQSIYAAANVIIFSVLWLSGIPVYRCTTSVHFSVSGFFIGFYVLAIVNSATLKIGVHMSFQMINFSRCKPRSGIVGSYDTSGFSVSRNLPAVFHRGFTIHIPTRFSEDSLFRTSSAVFISVDLFDDGHCDQCRRKWQPTPVTLPGEFHGQRSLAGYSPCGRKEPDTAEHTAHVVTV